MKGLTYEERGMSFRLWVCTATIGFLLPATAFADDSGFFAGLAASGGKAFGSSSTTDGGAPFAGGGVVDNVKFRGTAGFGGHAGYRFTSPLSVFVSYNHIRGGIGWDVDFPVFGISSGFKGTATSHEVMGNLAYDFALSDTTVFRASAGLGFSVNTLSSVVETDKGSGLYLANVADHTRISPAAQIGAGIHHNLTQNTILGLNATASYSNGFETGDTRSGNLGVTSINPYRIDDVFRANLEASLRLRF